MIDKDSIVRVASGRIDNPRIAMEIDGQQVVAEGSDAQYFALGILAGIKMAHPESETTITDSTS